MEKLFVSFELALILKEKGFDSGCLAHYYRDGRFRYKPFIQDAAGNPNIKNEEEEISAPLYQQVIDWVREEHEIDFFLFKLKSGIYKFDVHRNGECKTLPNPARLPYYEALDKAIEEALKLI